MIYEHDGQKYLLLTPQCQIEKNRQDIEAIINDAVAFNYIGMKVVGQVNTADELPKKSDYEVWPFDYGDAFAVGTKDPYNYYLWTRAFGAYLSDHWFNIGIFPGPSTVPGPTGPTGATGAAPNLTIGSVTSTLSQPQVTIEGTSPNYTLNFKLQKGDKGDAGTNGRNGVDGKNGKDGTNAVIYTVKGAVDTVSQLPVATSVSTDTAYVVKDGSLLYGIIVQNGTNVWYNYGSTSVGPRGPAGIGTTDLTAVQFPYGEQTITFDDTDGLAISATGQFSYGTETATPQMDISIPIKAGEGITMDADTESKFLVVKNADHAALAKKVDLIDDLTDTTAVVYAAQRKQYSDGSYYYYDYTPIRAPISSLEARSIARRGNDGSIQASETSATSGQAYDNAVVVVKQMNRELAKKVDKATTKSGKYVYVRNNAEDTTFGLSSSATASTIAQRDSAGAININQGTSLNSAVALNTIEPVVITPTTTSSVNGTITADQLSRLQQTSLSSVNTKPGIYMNNEYYAPMDKGHTAGYLGYTHIGYENSTMIAKNITITVSTKTWVLNTVYIQPRSYKHNISMSKDPGSSEGYSISFALNTNSPTAYTSYSQLYGSVGTTPKIHASGGYLSDQSDSLPIIISSIELKSATQISINGIGISTDGGGGGGYTTSASFGTEGMTFTDKVTTY